MKAESVVSVSTYVAIWVSLIALTFATTGIAFIDLGGRWNLVAALLIAIFKTLLVVLFFMHLRYSSRLLWIFASVGVFWLMIMFALTMADPTTRNWFVIG